MARLIWTEPALHTLDEITEYIALDEMEAAKKLVQQTFKTAENLEKFPNSGKRPQELTQTQDREKIVSPCRVFYRAEKDDIYILYIRRSERQL